MKVGFGTTNAASRDSDDDETDGDYGDKPK